MLRRSRRGQALILFAMTFVVIVGFASLAIDGSHLYMVHRQDQNAADAGALAGANVMSKITTTIVGPPASDGAAEIKAIHDIVAANGFATQYPSQCQSGANGVFQADWFDTSPGCGATTGFSVKVHVQVPPAVLVGPCDPVSPNSDPNGKFHCIEVDITDRVNNYLLGAFGTPVTTSSVMATAYAKQVVPGVAFTAIPPTAVWLYEGATTSCAAGPQCFNRSSAPTKSQLTCGLGTCPTLWTQPGTAPTFVGIDGNAALSAPKPDTLALYSNGDAVIQDPTNICDPYNAAACPNANPQGYALSTGAQIYCSSQTSPAPVPCSTTRPGNAGPALSGLTGSQTGPPPPFNFAPNPPAPTNRCGGLVLNGEAVTSASFVPAAPDPTCLPPVADPYTILPGHYDYIVINHGQYTFEQGFYDVTGVAPVTRKTDLLATTIATDGIDHSAESTANDFDLCNTGTAYVINNPLSNCQGLTAGVWIGQGRMGFSPFSPGNSANCLPGQPQSGTQGGGGGPTIISGSGVSFRLQAGGFVSTREATTVSLTGPSPGALPEINGAPTLIDMENPTSTIHLDASGSSRINNSTVASGFGGLVFQAEAATAGGVELDPGLSGVSGKPALRGQVVAYSLTTFGGRSGTAVDFSQGYGTGSPGVIVPSARAEPAIISSNIPNHQPPAKLADNLNGTETFTEWYGDEWALDNYDSYFKINGGNPIFFSRALWVQPLPPGSTLPPQGQNPSDTFPARPLDASPPAGYTVNPPGAPNTHDWYFTGTDPSLATSADPGGTFKFESNGYWMWGHEQFLRQTFSNTNEVSLSLTFPKQSGNTVQIQGYLTDGDRCGDFATFDDTLTQPGGPGGGSAPVPGGQQLLQ